MELTLTTEHMSGTRGTRICGDKRMTRRVVAPEAVARSTMTRLTPRACFRISAVSASAVASFGVQRLGIERDHLDGRVATGYRRTEGADQAGTLIAGAEEERQQAIGSGIDQQNALTARGKHAAQGCHETGFAHAAGQRKDSQNGSARGRGRRRRLRGHIVFKDAAQGKPARDEAIAGTLQRVLRRRRKRRLADGLWALRH